ncbi:MAG: LysM peptidoglycan-binding domain-containing protein [Chlamydiae bacterium]|nr:LysM peptidoglycan-binding domain-containing protein [Chlamydiota bacterium]
MSKKNTIIIAVLVNAGLLVVLFISALSSKKSVQKEPTQNEIAQLVQDTSIDAKTLYTASDVPQTGSAELPNIQVQPLSTNGTSENTALAIDPAAMQTNPVITPVAEPTEVVHALPSVEQPNTAPVVETPKAEEAATALSIHVKKGDTLDKIARNHRTSVAEIIRLNNLSSSFLKVGQTLNIPKKNGAVASKKGSTSLSSEYYVVKVGENPYTIALKHHMKTSELLKLNNLDEKKARRLKAGDRLRIR